MLKLCFYNLMRGLSLSFDLRGFLKRKHLSTIGIAMNKNNYNYYKIRIKYQIE